MVRRVAFGIPGDLATPTGGYAYDRRIIAELAARDWRADVVDLGEGFPFPDAATREAAQAKLAGVPSDMPVVVDGLALGALPETAARLAERHRLIALIHHPLALETGLAADEAAALRRSETRALGFARRVIVTSAFTARLLVADYAVGPDRVAIIRPGVDRPPLRRAVEERRLALLAVGAVVARKGYDILLGALATLRDMPWRLTVVGDLTRDAAAVARLMADIVRFDLAGRIAVAGAVSPERLAVLYASADIFALASRFEGYGMAFAEAIAHGVPVVGTTAGAISETVPPAAGLLVAPGDSRAFAAALRRLIERPDERRRLAEGASAAAAMLPTWTQAAVLFEQALEAAA